MVGGERGQFVAALEFGSGAQVAAKGREKGSGLLSGQVFQVGDVKGRVYSVEDFAIEVQVAFARFGFTGSLESGFFFALGLVVGRGALFPTPLLGLFAGGLGGPALAVCPDATGSCLPRCDRQL